MIKKFNPAQEKAIVIAIFTLICFVVFLPALKGKILNWDDPIILDQASINIMDLGHVKKIFTQTVISTYNPLTVLSFALEYKFFQHNSFIYHLDNLLLHIWVTVLIFLFGKKLRLSSTVSFLAALLFAIHPMHVESVSWITERKDVLYSVFYMLALNSYVSFLRFNKRRFYARSILWGCLSMLAKPMAVSLPLILLLLDWFYEKEDVRKCLVQKIPFLLYVLPIVYLTQMHTYNVFQTNEHPIHAVLIFIWTFSFYIFHFIFPITLIPLYQTPEPISFSNPIYLSSFLILVLTCIVLFRFRKNKWLIFSFMFFLCSIFFMFRFDKMTNLAVVADRYMYLPSVGFCLLAGIGGEKFLNARKNAALCVFLIISILFAGKTFQQTKIWNDSLTLWNYVIKQEPALPVAYNNRGYCNQLNGDLTHALADYQKAVELSPEYVNALNNLGSIYFAQKNYKQALELINRSLQIDPRHATSYYNKGALFEEIKQYDFAFIAYSEAIEYDPDLISAYQGRVNMLLRRNEPNAALSDLNRILSLKPNHIGALTIRGSLYARQKKYDLALKDYADALNINNRTANVYLNRSFVYREQGMKQLALDDALKAQALGAPNLETYIASLK
jgi:tetratricopeptide (TPR) repeat protein